MQRPWLNRLVLPLAILAVFFLVPVDAKDAPIGVLAGALASVLGLGLVAWVTVTEVRRAEQRLQPVHLAIALELALVSFASVYYLLAVSSPAEFTGLSTRVDALYLSMATVSTVGFGDVSATGQLARLLVTGQMAFNLAFVAALVGLLQGRIRERRADRQGAGPSRPEAD